MRTFIFLFIVCLVNLHAHIQLIKKENSDSNTTLLVIGGIHGNEPGGYFSASLLATHYTITSKNLWIVPNLNAHSIIANKRGIHGDMNRKFAKIAPHDPDKHIVDGIKKIILSKKVSLVLNLHDGHGFYRKENKGSIFNPNAWGQTCVIDQCTLKAHQQFGDLNTIAMRVRDKVNKRLLKKHHSFNVKNTKTKYDDEAMQLSLTYFAVTNNKPAFAIETSKNLSSLSQKVFYQLLAIEEFMHIVGIEFSRDFDLNEKNIKKILRNNGTLAINGNILLNLRDIKKSLSFIPLKSSRNEFKFSHPLGAYKKVRGNYEIFIGNKKLTTLKPQYFQMAQNCPQKYDFVIDGVEQSVAKTSEIFVMDDFSVMQSKNYRVNVIGYHAKGKHDESGITIKRGNLSKRYSVDAAHHVYRVEFYKNNEFCSMSFIHFK